MKKMLILLIVVLLLAATVIPVFAFNGGGDAGNNTGDGEPPGWSMVNPGSGGSTGPAEGPFGPK